MTLSSRIQRTEAAGNPLTTQGSSTLSPTTLDTEPGCWRISSLRTSDVSESDRKSEQNGFKFGQNMKFLKVYILASSTYSEKTTSWT
ncbi:uncharacterized [Tachysurus ichikawai]